jgi:hypothetical protein
MRFTWACFPHALERHYRTYWNPAILIPVKAHVADEVGRLQ